MHIQYKKRKNFKDGKVIVHLTYIIKNTYFILDFT